MNETDAGRYRSAIAEIAAEEWRFRRAARRAAELLDGPDRRKFEGQYAWLHKRVTAALAAAGLRAVDFTGRDYDTGMPVTALNLDDFGPDEALVVCQVIEPVIMAGDQVQRTGTVLLGRRET